MNIEESKVDSREEDISVDLSDLEDGGADEGLQLIEEVQSSVEGNTFGTPVSSINNLDLSKVTNNFADEVQRQTQKSQIKTV